MQREEYEGPDTATVAIGEAAKSSISGLLVGAAGGAIVGALIHNEAASQAAAHKPGLVAAFQRAGRGAKALYLAIAGAVVGGTIAEERGYFRGANKDAAARAQFERINVRNECLQEQVSAAQAEAEKAGHFAERLAIERAKSADAHTSR